MEHQDWGTVTVGRNVRGTAAAGAGRARPSAGAIAAAKLDDAEAVRIKVLSADAVRTIQDYRRTHTLSQKQLDQACSFPANTINNLEARRAGPTAGQLQALNRLLKAGLTLE
jgi:ribosome-binding protein aMBF1 (putative translation factor)